MKNEIAIIGGGPVGLHLAFLLKEHNLSATIFEATPFLGGQMIALYPEKKMEYPEMFKGRIAIEVVQELIKKASKQKIVLNTLVQSFEKVEEGYLLKTNHGEKVFKILVFATGIGLSKPRTIGLEGEEKATNIYYSVSNPHIFENQNVLVLGGGNSAIDWAKQLSSFARSVTLIHRRKEFRGDASSLKDYPIPILTPYIPKELHIKADKAVSLSLENVETQETLVKTNLDAILVFYGRVAEKTPFLLPEPRSFLFQGYLHNKEQESLPNIYVVGDASFKDREEKKLDSGFKEAEIVLKEILKNQKL